MRMTSLSPDQAALEMPNGTRERTIMKRLSLVLIVTVWACVIPDGSVVGKEPPESLRPVCKADRPPR